MTDPDRGITDTELEHIEDRELWRLMYALDAVISGADERDAKREEGWRWKHHKTQIPGIYRRGYGAYVATWRDSNGKQRWGRADTIEEAMRLRETKGAASEMTEPMADRPEI